MSKGGRQTTGPVVLVALAAIAVALLFATPAGANVVLKSGARVSTTQTNCFSSFVTPSYSQQVAGTEPRVNDVFYLSLRVDFIVSFDCAADFFSAQATLPANLQPAIGGSATTICRRWGKNASDADVFDPRAQSNCVANPPFNGTTRVLNLRPATNPTLPEVGGPAGSFWFTGIRSPQESQEFNSVQLLVPVKASAQISNQPIQFQVCTVGTDCVAASVNLSVTAAPADVDPPLVSLPGSAQTSAVGARVPFTINDNPAGSSYYLKVDTSTNAAFPLNTTSGRPCGLNNPVTFAAAAGPPVVPFSGLTTSEIQYGDLQTGGTTCYLTPQTTYHLRVCSVRTTDLAELSCRTSSFATGAVTATMSVPTIDPQPSNGLTVQTQVVAGHPAGNLKVQRRFSASGPGGAFVDASGNLPVGQSVSSTSAADQAVTLPDPWRAYDIRACFVAAQTSCSTAVRHVAGSVQSVADASSITPNSAVVSGRPSTPRPPGTLSVRIATVDPNGADPVLALFEETSIELPVDGSNLPAAPTDLDLTSLQPATQYWWTACFDNPADAGIEDCGAVRTFTTLPATGPTGVANLSRVNVSGAARIRKGRMAVYRVGITNSGDAAATGVRVRVSGRGIKAGAAVGAIPAGVARTVKVRLKPTKPGRMVASFRVSSENAGARTVKKTLTVSRR